MILNVSGRTDIVAFYTSWFINRYHEGFLDVRNPFYKKQVSRIYFKDVDLIVFCTKNPLPILDHLNEIKIPIVFHITITPYKKDIEPNVIDKKLIIAAVKKISSIVGKEYTVVRYDPIFLSPKYDLNYHLKCFERLCEQLDGYINHIIVSFIDEYKNVKNNSKILNIREPNEEDYEIIGTSFSNIAKKHNITVQTCAEKQNLVQYGFIKSDCLTPNMVFKLTGLTKMKKWTSRKTPYCDCVEMVDVGAYNTCLHFCKYCYANYSEKEVIKNNKLHNPTSSLLIGEIESDDIIKVRKK